MVYYGKLKKMLMFILYPWVLSPDERCKFCYFCECSIIFKLSTQWKMNNASFFIKQMKCYILYFPQTMALTIGLSYQTSVSTHDQVIIYYWTPNHVKCFWPYMTAWLTKLNNVFWAAGAHVQCNLCAYLRINMWAIKSTIHFAQYLLGECCCFSKILSDAMGPILHPAQVT